MKSEAKEFNREFFISSKFDWLIERKKDASISFISTSDRECCYNISFLANLSWMIVLRRMARQTIMSMRSNQRFDWRVKNYRLDLRKFGKTVRLICFQSFHGDQLLQGISGIWSWVLFHCLTICFWQLLIWEQFAWRVYQNSNLEGIYQQTL